jgi:hypothetical protein
VIKQEDCEVQVDLRDLGVGAGGGILVTPGLDTALPVLEHNRDVAIKPPEEVP